MMVGFNVTLLFLGIEALSRMTHHKNQGLACSVGEDAVKVSSFCAFFDRARCWTGRFFLYGLLLTCLASHALAFTLAPAAITHWNDSFWYMSQANFFLGGKYWHESPIRPLLNSEAFSTYMAPGYGFVIAVFVAIFGASWQVALTVFQHICALTAKWIILQNAFRASSLHLAILLLIRVVAICFCLMPLTVVLPATVMSESVSIALFACFLRFLWKSLYSDKPAATFAPLALCTAMLLFVRGEKVVICLAICVSGALVIWLHRGYARRVSMGCISVATGLAFWTAITLAFNYQQHGMAVLSTGTGRHLYNKFIGDLRLHEGADGQAPCLAALSALPESWWDEGAYPTALRCAKSEVMADAAMKNSVMMVLPRIDFSHIINGVLTPMRGTIQRLTTDKLMHSELIQRHCCRTSTSVLEMLPYRDSTYSDVTVPGLAMYTNQVSMFLYYGLYLCVAILFIALLFGKADRILLGIGLICILSAGSKLFLERIIARHLIDIWYVIIFWMSAWIATPTRGDVELDHLRAAK